MPPDEFTERAARPASDAAKELLAELLRCLRFYSRMPAPALPWEREPHGAPDFRTMPRVLPLAGAVIGLAGALVLVAAQALALGAWLSAVLAVAALTLATGAFHEDGLADTADGFGGGATPERRLEIMRDSHIGTYGAAALALAYALRIACLAELTARLGPAGATAAIVLVAALSRTAGLVPLTLLAPARASGASYAAGRPPGRMTALAFALCGALGFLAALATPLPFPGIALGFALAVAVALALTRLSARLIGGQTGDVAGGVQQLAEIAAYLGLLIAARP